MAKDTFYNMVATYLAGNESLCRLLALAIQAAYRDDIPFPQDKLLGDWDFATAGQKLRVVWTDPYREDEGYIFFLPGLESQNVYQGAIVHIPNSYDTEGEQKWYTLKHLAIFADQIELLPNL